MSSHGTLRDCVGECRTLPRPAVPYYRAEGRTPDTISMRSTVPPATLILSAIDDVSTAAGTLWVASSGRWT